MKPPLHTCDHILFTILENKFQAKARALQFNENRCRAVYVCETDLRPLQREVENGVNNVLKRKLEVKNYSIARMEAKNILDLSMVPSDCEEISVYEIVGFNKLACVGPHVKNTGVIKKFSILKIEKKGQNCYAITFTAK